MLHYYYIYNFNSNALMQDLNHPNEYIRGSTLRFMCKLKEPELLESLIESIKSNLEHRHSYVRRNAVLAIYSIYKDFEELIPDAPQIIYDFLLSVSLNYFFIVYLTLYFINILGNRQLMQKKCLFNVI